MNKFYIFVIATMLSLMSPISYSETINLSPEDVLFTPEILSQSINDTIVVLEQNYVFPKKAKAMGEQLQHLLASGKFDHIQTRSMFIKEVGSIIRELSGDGHLGLYQATSNEVLTHVLTENLDNRRFNYAFEHVQVLNNNIGYLKFNKFYQDDDARQVFDHALGFLSQTKAMIIDLRESTGGSVEFVEYMISHFIEEDTLLWNMLNREGENVYQGMTKVVASDRRFKQDYPLFILTSKSVVSAGEFFTYTLKHLDRATIVGEQTSGQAHWTGVRNVNEFVNIRIPLARPVNPITQSNWEGVGVVPDFKVAANESLKFTIDLANKRLVK